MKAKLALIFLTLLSSCANQELNMFGMPHPPTDGPPEYIAGWKAGCETGMTTYSNDFFRTRYRLNVDGEMMANPRYNRGWENGQSYCRYYVSNYLVSHKKYTGEDLRSSNTWFEAESDGLFSYHGAEKLDWMPIARAE